MLFFFNQLFYIELTLFYDEFITRFPSGDGNGLLGGVRMAAATCLFLKVNFNRRRLFNIT